MRRILLLIFWQFGLLAGGQLFADVVTLKDGRQISGLVETGNIQQLHIKVGDQSQTLDIHDVQAIQFGISLPAAPSPPKAADLVPRPAPVALVAGVVGLIGGLALMFAGKGVTNLPTQSAFLDSKRGRK